MYIERCKHGSEGSVWKTAIAIWQVAGRLPYLPDDTDYTVYTQVWDTWTPDGMLSVNLNDYTTIRQSVFDDWYTNRE